MFSDGRKILYLGAADTELSLSRPVRGNRADRVVRVCRIFYNSDDIGVCVYAFAREKAFQAIFQLPALLRSALPEAH